MLSKEDKEEEYVALTKKWKNKAQTNCFGKINPAFWRLTRRLLLFLIFIFLTNAFPPIGTTQFHLQEREECGAGACRPEGVAEPVVCLALILILNWN
jgi:hypothetical protein